MNGIPISTTQQTNTSSIMNTQSTTKPAENYTDSSLLQEGSIITGEVIDHNRSEVTILLNNNQTITALLSPDSQIKIGESFTFQVMKDKNSQLILQLMDTDTSPFNSTILEALKATNLPKSERNQEIVRELLKHQMSIDKQSILDILQHSIAFKGTSISSLILMTKHNIPITKENVTQFEHYKNYKHKIIDKLNQITDSLSEIVTKATIQVSSNESASLLGEMLHRITANKRSYSLPSTQEANDLLLFLDSHPAEKHLFSQILNGEGNLSHLLDTLEKKSIHHPTITHMKEQYKSYQNETKQIDTFLSLKDRNSLITDIQRSFPSNDIPASIQNGTMTTEQLLAYLGNQLSLSTQEHPLHILNNKQFQTIFKEHFIYKWTLTPEDITQKDAVSDLYNKIVQDLSNINDFVSQLKFYFQDIQESQPFKQLEQDTTDTKQNIDFIKTLNQLFTYIQLPLQLKNQTVHSELYVYTNKKNLKQNKNKVNALLHLDMDYLGSLDIHVNLNHKQISSKFYLENDELQVFLSQHITELGSVLESKGYIFHGEVLRKDKESNIIDHFLETGAKDSPIQKYSFDIRA